MFEFRRFECGRFESRSLHKLTCVKKTEFSVNGSNIPDLSFDVGPSFAGLLPISADPTDENQLYYWFWPSDNVDSEKEILIWLNGGVCS